MEAAVDEALDVARRVAEDSVAVHLALRRLAVAQASDTLSLESGCAPC